VTGQDRFEHVEVRSVHELHAWLLEHHEQQEAVWLVTWKKAVPDRYVPREQVMDELIAFGWIDGIRRRLDDERTRQLVSPRRTQPWARSYRQRAERLLAEGRLQPSGLRAVRQAKASGMWDVMDDVDDLLVPSDLAAALAARPPAAEHFGGFPPSTRRNVLRWIASARTEATRSQRIGRTVEEAAEGRRVRSNG
jgi:uncharacterized protein YdeI (YjbR/CyaY-like superfamily)